MDGTRSTNGVKNLPTRLVREITVLMRGRDQEVDFKIISDILVRGCMSADFCFI